MGKNYTYVDNSNVFIEGRRVSAVVRQLPGASSIVAAMNNRVVDNSWQLDYGRLHQLVCGGDASCIGAANLWGSPPPSDSFWEMVRRKGFKVTTYEKNYAGKEKKIDVAVAYQITKDAFKGLIDKDNDEITLVAGDKDYVPLVEDLLIEGFKMDVVFWDHAAPELRDAVTNSSRGRFVSLNQYLDLLTKPWTP